MAKKVHEVVLDETQKTINSSLSPELSTEYMQAVAMATKLRKVRARLNIRDVNILLSFYESNNFTDEQKKSIALTDKQRARLIGSVKKIGYSDYAGRVASQPFITNQTNKKLTKMIKKDTEESLDYAKFYFNQHKAGTEDLTWCSDMVLKPVKKNLKSKKPAAASYDRIAEFVYATTDVQIKDGSLNLEGYDKAIMPFADKIFGTDKEIIDAATKKALKKLKLTKKETLTQEEREKVAKLVAQALKPKQTFIEKVKKAVETQHDTHQIAKIDSAAQEELWSQIDDKSKKHIMARAEELFDEKYKDELGHANAVLEDMKKRHPNDYEEYLNKLRQSKVYKQAYAKYSKEYAQSRAEMRSQAIEEYRADVNTHSRGEALETGPVEEESLEQK